MKNTTPRGNKAVNSRNIVNHNAAVILHDQRQQTYRETDRMFAILMFFQWLAGIGAALFITPTTWIGETGEYYLHVWAAAIIGGVISLVPVSFAMLWPGTPLSRYSIAIGQMLTSSLLIHLTGGRIETHFHVFGSLVFLSFYRDWRVLIPASIVVATDQLIRGIFYPQSVFGVFSPESWRWVEHAAWLAFQDTFLIIACMRGLREMRQMARSSAELNAREARYLEITNSASDAIATVDETGRILFVNPAAENIFGYEAGELIGEFLSKLTVEDIAPPCAPAIKDPAAPAPGERLLPVEVTARDKNGREFPVEISFGEFEVDGKPRFSVVIKDVTEHRETQAALKRSEEYRKLFKHGNDAVIIFDPETEIVLDVNDRACSLYGYRREDFIGINVSAMSMNAGADQSEISKLLQEGFLALFESVQYRKDGTPIHLTISASMIEFEGRQAVLTINRDITARVLADGALKESENKFRSLIENMSEGLLQLDIDNKIIFTNNRLCEMTGYSHGELIGTNVSDLLIGDGSREIVRDSARIKKGDAKSLELKVKKKAGDFLWSIVGAVPATNSEGKLVGSMAVITDITERKRSEQQLMFNAMHDVLTGLPNRALFLEHLRSAILRAARSREKSFAVLFLDFDRFKIINDSLGHMEGDNLLVMIARRLEDVVRGSDIVARLGGDEFTILLDEVPGIEGALKAVSRVQDSLKAPFMLGEREVFISTSIGIAMSRLAYTKPEEILRDADIAMYRAKAQGQSGYEVFNQEMHEQANHRLEIETELRLALERNEFCVFYQPIVNLESGGVVGFEALVRWMHPSRGLVPPMEFIPLAEENGMITPIGEWVFRESCRQLHEWQCQDPANAELTMSVNISCKQFLRDDLADRIALILIETGIDARLLRIEITESHLMDSPEKAMATIAGLRELGIKISIDDFGTGYSSLSYLHRMPINFLKIDRSFVSLLQANCENNEITRTILMMAKNLGFEVIAEGVETEEQLEQLRLLNCQFAQGYLFSRPVPPEEIPPLLTRGIQRVPTIPQAIIIPDSIHFALTRVI